MVHKFNVKKIDEAIDIINGRILVSHSLVDTNDIIFALIIYLQSIIEDQIKKYARQMAEILKVEYNKI